VEGTVDVQAVAVKRSRGACKLYFLTAQRQIAAVGKMSDNVNVIIGAFFQAVGVQVEKNAVERLCKRSQRQAEDKY
jgi:hypothetical protein